MMELDDMPDDLPDFDEFISWARNFGLDVDSWSSNNKIQFWTFFCYGWKAKIEETKQ
jgi:hypothetical protein